MGLLDITPKIDETLINPILISCCTALNFQQMSVLPNWFRKDIYITKDLSLDCYIHCIAIIQIPKGFEEGDEVKICINFHEGFKVDSASKKHQKLQINKLKPMTFKSNMYTYIQDFLSKDNILQHINNSNAWDC